MDAVLTPEREAELLAADAIGDIIEHWGFRKGLGRVWTVLFLAVETLPAQAVGNLGLTFGETWRRSRGNTWRLFWGVMATTTPPLLIAQFIFVAVIGVPGTASFVSNDFVARMTVVSTVTAMYYLLVLPIGIGFLSHAYRYFFEGEIQPAE